MASAFVYTILSHRTDRKLPHGVPAYIDSFGNLYTHQGEPLGCSTETANSNPDDVHRTARALDGTETTYQLSGKLVQVRCPHTPSACRMATAIRSTRARRDSIGGILLGVVTNLPIGLGEPCFDKVCTGLPW